MKHFSEAVQQSDAQRQKYQNEKAHRLQNVMPIVILKKVSSKQLVGLCNGIGQIFQYRKYRNIRSSIITCHLPSTCPYDQLCEQEIQNHSCSCAAKTSSNVGMDLFSVHIAEQKQQKICQQEQTKVIKARLIARKAHDQKQCSLYDRFSKICGTNHTLCRQNRKQK